MITTESLETLIAEHPFWDGLNPQYISLLKESAELARYGVGQQIFQEGQDAEHLYLIQHGQVALETFVPGRGMVTTEAIITGDALGWSWLFPPYRWHFSAHSIEPTELIVFDAARLRAHAQENHDFGYELVTRMAQVMLNRLQATRMKLLDFYHVLC